MQLGDHRACCPVVRVLPVVQVLGIAASGIGNADTAYEAGLSINHQELAMRPVVQPDRARSSSASEIAVPSVPDR